MANRLTLAEKLTAIRAAEELRCKYNRLDREIREAQETFSCFISGQSQRHAHPELTDFVKERWIEELKSLKADLESEIVACTFEGLYRDFESEG